MSDERDEHADAEVNEATSDPANLLRVDFRREPGESPILVVNEGRRCKHGHLLLDCETRTVACRDCDAAVDAFDGLSALIENWKTWRYWLVLAKKEKARLESESAAMKVENKNARARLERARKRLPLTGGERGELEHLRLVVAAYRRQDRAEFVRLVGLVPVDDGPG